MIESPIKQFPFNILPESDRHLYSSIYNPEKHGEYSALVFWRALLRRYFPNLPVSEDEKNPNELQDLFAKELKSYQTFYQCYMNRQCHMHFVDEPLEDKHILLALTNNFEQLALEKLDKDRMQALTVISYVNGNQNLSQKLTPWCKGKALTLAAIKGWVNVVEDLLRSPTRSSLFAEYDASSAGMEAVKKSNLKIISLMKERQPDILIRVLDSYPKKHKIVMKIFELIGNELSDDLVRHVFAKCAYHGNLRTCQWLVENMGDRISENCFEQAFECAALRGELGLMAWLLENKKINDPLVYDKTLQSAFMTPKLEVVEFLLEKVGDQISLGKARLLLKEPYYRDIMMRFSATQEVHDQIDEKLVSFLNERDVKETENGRIASFTSPVHSSCDSESKEETNLLSMPNEFILQVLTFLDNPSELLKAGILNKSLHVLTKDDSLWNNLLTLYFPNEVQEYENNADSFQDKATLFKYFSIKTARNEPEYFARACLGCRYVPINLDAIENEPPENVSSPSKCILF